MIKNFLKKISAKTHRIYFSLLHKYVQCNICFKKARLFSSDVWHLYTVCPECGSQVRHRLLVASLLHDNIYFNLCINNKSVLHFAPEKELRKLISENTANYKTADFFTEGYFYDNIDYNIDISAMKELNDQSFDCVIACDVLEHVPNDTRALNEIYRVLRNGGYGIFTVPQKDGLEFTDEDITIVDPKLREKRFGQFDHVRIYGTDFPNKLKLAGFEVEEVDERIFDEKFVKKYVLAPPIPSRNPLATNFRKIFYAKKP